MRQNCWRNTGTVQRTWTSLSDRLLHTLCTLLIFWILALVLPPRITRAQPLVSPGDAAPGDTTPGAAVSNGSTSPSVPSGLVPLPQPHVLAPVPESFDWVNRETPTNFFLESVLSLREGRPQLLMSISLIGEYSDNFFRAESNSQISTTRDRQEEYSLGVALSSVYRIESGHGFVSLANTIRGDYRILTEERDIAFANVALNAGYQWPRLSLALSETLVRDDDRGFDSTEVIRRQRGTFLRNNISPQLRYAFSRTTSGNLGYTHTLVIDDSNNGTIIDENGNIDTQQGSSQSHAATIGLQHRFTPSLRGDLAYTFRVTDNDQGSDEQSQRLTANLNYSFARLTSTFVQAFGSIADRSAPSRSANTYGISFGVRRALTPFLSAVVSVGPTFFVPTDGGDDERVFVNWQVNLDGALPLFRTRLTSLVLTARQNVDDTSTEVDNVGLTLRQIVSLTLNHTVSRALRTSLFTSYVRSELLESIGTTASEAGRVDNVWSTGARASYALTRILSLVTAYQYQQRLSNNSSNNFQENRVTITLSASFPVF